ncbi:hypothetical protein GPECTOR_1g622 [Gonium pectorale]|uniref:Uncharacterized protein n=1 Tax=Gonium pectorale TaxID=33097 RepID=A0A150H3P2_GONPE|nr:hypothetical protein GPECTOR_1g622 [Gonium pectorale]|eukprot:KXZ56691.1 hypothetical protein GPECTOR_1g622 [Gonium pectorale]
MEFSGFSAPSGGSLTFSYASPDVVRQAKLEALELRIRHKMLEDRSNIVDPYALRGPDPEPDSSLQVAACALPGGRDQIASLVVPADLGEHGERVEGSGKLVLDGERMQLQWPAVPAAGAGHHQLPAAAGGVPTPRYRTTDVTDKLNTVAGGLASARASMRGRRPAWVSGQGAGGVAQREPLSSQLSEGMLAFVAANVERPKGVGRNAFVPQGGAVHEAQENYRSARPARPSSAPHRRQPASGSPRRQAVAEVDRERDRGGGSSGSRSFEDLQDLPVAQARPSPLDVYMSRLVGLD